MGVFGGSGGMRNTIIASTLGGLLVAGACIFMTGATVDNMKEQAVTAMANMPAQADTSQQDGKDGQQASGSAASADGKSDDASGKSDEKPGAASDGTASDGSSSAAATDPDKSGGASGGTSDGSGDVEVVGRGMRGGEEVYIIKWGDTLSYISAETGFSVDEIANLNEIRDVDLIYADSALRIPSGD